MTPEAVVLAAVSFFGPEGVGLTVKDQAARRAHFRGGGGDVEVTTRRVGKETKVEIMSQKWENEVEVFVGQIEDGR